MLKNFISKTQRSLQMKLVWNLRWHIFLEIISKVLALIKASLNIFLLGILIWGFNKIIPFIEYIQDPAIATLIGAVIGALVGGMFAYTSAVDVHKKELESTATLKRRDEIYRPLYNDLLNLKKDYQLDPLDSKSAIFTHKHLPFRESAIWQSFKQDTKIHQTPINLVKAMDELSYLINLGKESQSAVPVDAAFRKLLKAMDNLFKTTKDDEKLKRFYEKLDKIDEKINLLESVKDFDKNLADIHLKLDEIIQYLEELIGYINNRFQQKANWY